MDTNFAQLLNLRWRSTGAARSRRANKQRTRQSDKRPKDGSSIHAYPAAEEARILEKEHLEEAKKSYTDAQD
ncbi:hypothetical protein FRB95_005064 [Tulasnella sp. JGI-2019a]|nr:hypothetical protein FRB95_005064 [Tulasnella sp. JGI-2019a]